MGKLVSNALKKIDECDRSVHTYLDTEPERPPFVKFCLDPVQIPTFPECDHDLVKALIHLSDADLVNQLQQSPKNGKYFTAIFCRYSPVVYSLIRHSARSPVQAEYLFAMTWRHILNELGGIDLARLQAQPARTDEASPAKTSSGELSLQAWLIGLTAAYINQAAIPDVEDIHYSLKAAPPPLWCYTERALDGLLPKHRLIILMAQTFEWSETRIAAYLQAEGDRTSPQAVSAELELAYQALERAIPADMQAIYLGHPLAVVPALASAAEILETPDISDIPNTPKTSDTPKNTQGSLTIEFDESDL